LLIEPEPLDRGIQMRRSQMRAENVENSKLLFESGKNGRRAQLARVRKRLLFHGPIPDYPIRPRSMVSKPCGRDERDLG
jgi:hypothetical protein